MKILLISQSSNYKAGTGRMVLGIAKSFVALGGNVKILAENIGEHVEIEGKLFVEGIEVEQIKISNLKAVDFFPLIKSLIKIRKNVHVHDVTVCFDVNPVGILTYFATFFKHKKVINHVVADLGILQPHSPIRNWFIRRAYDSSAFLVVINSFVKRKVEDSGYIFKKHFVIPLGVDVRSFESKRTINNQKNHIGEYVLTVGAFKKRKGYDLSIEAFSKISKTFPNLKYLIVGGELPDNDFVREQVKFISDNMLSDRVIFKKNLSEAELQSLYVGAKFFIMCPISRPTSFEGFGQVYLEAGLFGIPAIGTTDSGAEVAILNNNTGIVVEPKSDKIAEAMLKLLTDEELRKEMGENAKSFAMASDILEINKRYYNVLKDEFSVD